MRVALVVALLSGACVHTETSACDDGTLCREGTVCHSVSLVDGDGAPRTTTECVTDDQIHACDDKADLDPCDGGTCYSHACLPAGCGNGRMDANETCDDGNVTLGDKCSSTCQTEVCGNGIVDPVDTTGETPVPKELCDDGNTLGHDGCASTCVPEVPHWRQLPGTPSLRNFSAMAVEVAARRAILFGGFSSGLFVVYPNGGTDGGFSSGLDGDPFDGSALGETWELSANGWTRIDSLFSPSPRGGHAMVNDGSRTLLVGGAQSAGAVFNDVWEFSDGRWKQLDNLPTEMGPRVGSAMAYWPQHGVILFGGQGKSDQAFDDTWLLPDGSHQWQPFDLGPSLEKPEARSFATLTFDAAHNRLILAGGTSSTNRTTNAALASWGLGDDGWQRLVPLTGGSDIVEPQAYGAVAAYDPSLGVVVYSGFSSLPGRNGDVWVWNGTAWSHSIASTPRFGATGSVDPLSGHLQVLGGEQSASTCDTTMECFTSGSAAPPNDIDNDVSVFDGSTWSKRHIIEIPPFLTRHGYTYDFDRARIVVFGGEGVDLFGSNALSSTTYEIAEHTWFKPDVTGEVMPVLVAPSVAYAALGSVHGTYVFGGSSTGGNIVTPTNDLFRLDQLGDGTEQWTRLAPAMRPGARAGAMMAFDPDRGRIVLFGGTDGTAVHLGDTWELDGTTWAPLSVDGAPPPREDAAFAYDPLRHLFLMWGGVGDAVVDNSDVVLGDFWTYDAAAHKWTELKPTFGPSPRPGARFVWDTRRRRMVLWGGTDNAIWEWDGANWEYVPAFESPIAHADALLLQAADGGILVHGGTLEGVSLTGGQTLELVRESLSQTSYAACESQLDEDRDGKSGCADKDCWAYCTPSCPPSGTGAETIACDTSQPHCGDGVCQSPRENCGICPQDCGECLVQP